MKKITKDSPAFSKQINTDDSKVKVKALDLKSKRKASDPEVQNYIAALESENLKLQKQIAKCHVEKMSSDNRILALEEIIKKCNHPKDLSDKEIDSLIKRNIEKLGYVKKPVR